MQEQAAQGKGQLLHKQFGRGTPWIDRPKLRPCKMPSMLRVGYGDPAPDQTVLRSGLDPAVDALLGPGPFWTSTER